jgi:hypothetical protein
LDQRQDTTCKGFLEYQKLIPPISPKGESGPTEIESTGLRGEGPKNYLYLFRRHS